MSRRHYGEVSYGGRGVVEDTGSSDAGDKEYITDTLTKHVRKIANILGSTEERVLISVNKYKAREVCL